MLLKQNTLKGIKEGSITVAFRRWRRPTVKSGGTLLTAIGQLAVHAVDVIRIDEITESDAVAAGFEDLDGLLSKLGVSDKGEIYRVRLSLAGPDPRIAMREIIPYAQELEAVITRLERMDNRFGSGPWTCKVLQLLRNRPATRAADLATVVGMDKAAFKVNVRKLKAMGLTRSLEIGYRLSARGEAVLDHLMNRSGEQD